MEVSDDCILTVNAGGIKYDTYASTLRRCQYFESLLSEHWTKIKTGDTERNLFVDVDGTSFKHFLNWLRNPSYEIPYEDRHILEFFNVEYGEVTHEYPVTESKPLRYNTDEVVLKTVENDIQMYIKSRSTTHSLFVQKMSSSVPRHTEFDLLDKVCLPEDSCDGVHKFILTEEKHGELLAYAEIVDAPNVESISYLGQTLDADFITALSEVHFGRKWLILPLSKPRTPSSFFPILSMYKSPLCISVKTQKQSNVIPKLIIRSYLLVKEEINEIRSCYIEKFLEYYLGPFEVPVNITESITKIPHGGAVEQLYIKAYDKHTGKSLEIDRVELSVIRTTGPSIDTPILNVGTFHGFMMRERQYIMSGYRSPSDDWYMINWSFRYTYERKSILEHGYLDVGTGTLVIKAFVITDPSVEQAVTKCYLCTADIFHFSDGLLNPHGKRNDVPSSQMARISTHQENAH